jgi:dTDP-4-dehydrorhamnose 3,5-epimerase
MVFTRLAIPDVVLLTPRRFADKRGWFAETYSAAAFTKAGISAVFVQDNHSCSSRKHTVRGLHFQRPPHAQAKLVRAVRGAIFDVAVDLRRNSPSYGRHVSAILSAEKGEEMFVPRGFAHGYCTLEDNTEVIYKVDAPYAPASEGGVLWNDPDLAIAWPVSAEDVSLAEKDAACSTFADFRTPFLI